MVRHGETDYNAQNVYQGKGLDEGLNEKGRKQAKLLGRWWKKNKATYPLPEIILTSPAKRAKETAKIIKDELVGRAKLPKIKVLSKLYEINHGKWEGLSDTQAKKKYPKLYSIWRNKPMKMKFPGGETMRKAKKRILKEGRKIKKRKEKIVAFVGHGGTHFQTINQILKSNKLRNIKQDNTCFNVIEKRANGDWRMVLINSTAHLL